MAPPTLEADADHRQLIRENTHTFVTLEANPLTATLAAPFAILQDDLLLSLSAETKLEIAIARAEAKARVLDEQIDALVDGVKHACLALTGGDTAKEPYLTYFAKKDPAEIKEPILDEEVNDTSAWLPALQASAHKSFNEIGAKLEPLLALAVPAMKELRDANQALLDFFQIGGRYTLVQRMNAARKLAHGQLGQLVHDHPELALVITFPEIFFLHDTRRRKDTPASINTQIEVLKKKIATLEIRRDKLAAFLAAEKLATRKKRSSARADEIARAEQAQAEAAARLAALRAEAEADDKDE